ncbi:carbon starvation protein A [Prolixibacteraceae bacterium JC049]|nr:carbon starvation protein A [Prolixibacteraceae bacterium JC049]
MITLLISIAALIAGYFLYSRFLDRLINIDDSNVTPAIKLRDNVDYQPIPTWKIFTIQFLNIAGLGPIFGAILGAMYGPVAYVWIVLGCIFMGAAHDYFSGVISLRNNGSSVPEMTGKYLGKFFQQFLRVFTLLLLVFVGVAFVNGPAGLLHSSVGFNLPFWLSLIFVYYLTATLLPVNKLIAKIYPFFGIVLLVMALMVGGYLIFSPIHIEEISFSHFQNLHHAPTKNILYPMLFIVISCGAISGFHSTQSPLMARCLKKESHARPAFYGAMIAEGIVTLIWATAAINYFGGTEGLNETFLAGHNPAWVVNEICQTWFGKFGAIIAIIGIVACPITTGDTAFRSARLTLADMLKIPQASIKSRLVVSIPLFLVGFFLSQLDFSTIWKYLGISNQILASIFLWTSAMYLVSIKKSHWYMSIPAFIMTTICATYLLIAPYKNGGFALPSTLSYCAGIVFGLISLLMFLKKVNQ